MRSVRSGRVKSIVESCRVREYWRERKKEEKTVDRTVAKLFQSERKWRRRQRINDTQSQNDASVRSHDHSHIVQSVR